jgi:hypothetical protein
MLHKIAKLTLILVLIIFFQAPLLLAKEVGFKIIDIFNLNRYFEDRIAYQQYEKSYDQWHADTIDNSIAVLMLIKDKRIYLFKDGYDDPEAVRLKILMYNTGNTMIPDLWENKINGSPNFVQISDRKVVLLRNISKEQVSANYKDFYIKIRDEFLKKHVCIFLSLIFNRSETEMTITRTELPKRLSDQSPTKYAISVTVRTGDAGAVYHAEDSDGDGITDTFTVNMTDGFSWGYKCGANTIFIKNNTQKDIEKIIGRITNIAYYGSPEEEQIIKKSLPPQDKINALINDLYRVDSETKQFLKDNKVNIDEMVERGSKGEDKK